MTPTQNQNQTKLVNGFKENCSKLTFVFDNGSKQELNLNHHVLEQFSKGKENPSKFAYDWASDLRGHVKEIYYS